MNRMNYMIAFGLLVLQSACISTPSDADECFAIESARCELRGRCLNNFDVEGCKYYYEEQCRAREIEVEYTDEQLGDCIASIYAVNSDGASTGECQILTDAIFESELCMTDAGGMYLFPSCAVIACPSAYEQNTDDGETDTGTETDVGDGLNP